MRTILLAAVLAASVSATSAFAADPAMTAQTPKGPDPRRCEEHDPLHVRQGHVGQVRLQWSVRHELAAPGGARGATATGDPTPW